MVKIATLLAISTTAYGLAFDGPLPTPVQDLVYAALDGSSPKPTNIAHGLPDLFRRQKAANSAVCGYLNADPDFPVTCSTGNCIFNASQKWFGCCSGSGTSSCPVVTRCINSASASKCFEDASCYNDPLAMACTAASAPFCINMYAKTSQGTMSHWVCGASSTSVAVLASATSESSSAKPTSPSSSRASTDASVIRQGGVPSTAAASSLVAAATSGSQTAAAGAATPSTGAGAAMHTAAAMAGLAGGLAGVFAIFL